MARERTQKAYHPASRMRMNDGNEIPVIGFGVWQSPPGDVTYRSVRKAIEVGYRHVDTAALYANEADVGRAARDSGLPRDELFVTTKLWNLEHGYDRAMRAFDRSLEALGFEIVDLYLIHWPVEKRRLDSWRALTEIKASGRARSIGVSNYTVRHLKELLDHSGIVPAVNQVEFSPFLYQKELLEFCRSHSILLQAYAPLTRGERLDDPTLLNLARKYQRTPAQILVRWCLEHGCVPLPKSNTPSRIEENFRVFDFNLDAEDVRTLDTLDEDFRTAWDPSDYP